MTLTLNPSHPRRRLSCTFRNDRMAGRKGHRSAHPTLTYGNTVGFTLCLSNLYPFSPRETEGSTRRVPTVLHTLGERKALCASLPRVIPKVEPRASSSGTLTLLFAMTGTVVDQRRYGVYPEVYRVVHTQGGIPGYIGWYIPTREAITRVYQVIHTQGGYNPGIHSYIHPGYTPYVHHPVYTLWYTPYVHHPVYTLWYTPSEHSTPCGIPRLSIVHPGYTSVLGYVTPWVYLRLRVENLCAEWPFSLVLCSVSHRFDTFITVLSVPNSPASPKNPLGLVRFLTETSGK